MKATLDAIAGPENITTQDGKTLTKYMLIMGDGTQVQTFSQAAVDALKPHKGKEVELTVDESEYKGQKQYKLTGAPGIWEKQAFGGQRGKGNWTPPDYSAEEQAKWPSFALSYAKDVAIAAGDTTDPASITHRATAFMDWLNKYRQAPKPTVPTAPAAPAPATASTATAASTNGDLSPAEKVELITLRKELRLMDPQQKLINFDEISGLSLVELKDIKTQLISAAS